MQPVRSFEFLIGFAKWLGTLPFVPDFKTFLSAQGSPCFLE